MEPLWILTLIIVGISVLLLSVGILIKGRFVNTHVSGNKALESCGVHCASTQDAELRTKNPHAVSEHTHTTDRAKPITWLPSRRIYPFISLTP